MRRPRRLPEDARRRRNLAADHHRALACASDRDRPAQEEHGIRGDDARRPLPKQERRQHWHNVASAPGVPQARSHLSYPYAVVALAIDPRDPGNIYAGSQTGGILKSADGGTTWAVANTGLTNRRVSTLIIDPRKPQSTLHEHRGRRVQEHNGGASWHPYNRGLPAGGVAAFAINPAGGTVFAGTNGDGVVALHVRR